MSSFLHILQMKRQVDLTLRPPFIIKLTSCIQHHRTISHFRWCILWYYVTTGTNNQITACLHWGKMLMSQRGPPLKLTWSQMVWCLNEDVFSWIFQLKRVNLHRPIRFFYFTERTTSKSRITQNIARKYPKASVFHLSQRLYNDPNPHDNNDNKCQRQPCLEVSSLWSTLIEVKISFFSISEGHFSGLHVATLGILFDM